MKHSGLLLLLVLMATASFGQAQYQPGYFISNDGQRTACQIRTMEWTLNKFEYKVEGGETKTGTTDDVMEFGVDNGARFRRFNVKIDRSKEELARLDFKRNPVYEDQVLFLQVVVEGKGSLYQYKEGELLRFFFGVDGAAPEMLVHKRYMATSTQASYNDMYKQQLFNALKCSAISQSEIEGMDYDLKDMTKVFDEFNSCHGASPIVAKGPDAKTIYHLSLRPGITYNSVSVTNSFGIAVPASDFSNTAAFRIGVELESVLPMQEGVWSLTIEPVYQQYTANSGNDKIDYKSLDFNIGARRRLFVRENSFMYLGASFVYSLPMSSTIKSAGFTMEVSTGINLALSAGYSINRFSAEINYGFSRGLLGNYASYNSSYKGPALVIGYRLF